MISGHRPHTRHLPPLSKGTIVGSGKTAMLCFDSSDASIDAFTFCLDNQIVGPGDSLRVIHIVKEPKIPAVMGLEAETFYSGSRPRSQEELAEEILDDLETYLGPLRDQKAPDVSLDFIVEFGSPAEDILRIASELNPNFIICGSHGKSNLKGAFLGSVSQFVLTHSSSIPVLIVRDPQTQREL